MLHYESEMSGIDKGVVTSLRFRLAWGLVERFATIAGKPDGEDSTGRSKLGLQTPEEIVDRAISIADYFIEQTEALEWFKPVTMSREEAIAELRKFARAREFGL